MKPNNEIIDDNFEVEQKLNSITSTKKIAHYNEGSIYYKGLVGLILCVIPAAIVGLVLIKLSLDQSKEARKSFKENPEGYLESSIKMVRKGRTFAYIGLGLFIIELVALMAYMSVKS